MPGLIILSYMSDKAGWFKVEDHMCTIAQGCAEQIAERKRLREQEQLGHQIQIDASDERQIVQPHFPDGYHEPLRLPQHH